MSCCCLSNGGGGHMITQAGNVKTGTLVTVRQPREEGPEMIGLWKLKYGKQHPRCVTGEEQAYLVTWLSFRSHSADFLARFYEAGVAAAVHDGVSEGFIRGSPKTTAQTNLRRRSFANPPEMPRRRCFFCSLFTRLLLLLTARQGRTFCRRAPDRTIRAGSLQESARL